MKSNASNGQFSNSAVCAPVDTNESTLEEKSLEKMKSLYPIDQQTKLLTLQAEAELLLRQLQALKQQRTEQSQKVLSHR